jgi:hypothetical protein
LHHTEKPLANLFSFCSNASNQQEARMDVNKQRELIRLWNQMRRVEGPAAEEIRIQILERFAERADAKRAA